MKHIFVNLEMTFLASSSRDRFIHVFDVNKDYQLVATLDDHSAAITSVRFASSQIHGNLQIVSCGADKSLMFRSIVKVCLFFFLKVRFEFVFWSSDSIRKSRTNTENTNSFVRITSSKNKHFTI